MSRDSTDPFKYPQHITIFPRNTPSCFGFFYPADGDTVLLRNIRHHLPDNDA